MILLIHVIPFNKNKKKNKIKKINKKIYIPVNFIKATKAKN